MGRKWSASASVAARRLVFWPARRPTAPEEGVREEARGLSVELGLTEQLIESQLATALAQYTSCTSRLDLVAPSVLRCALSRPLKSRARPLCPVSTCRWRPRWDEHSCNTTTISSLLGVSPPSRRERLSERRLRAIRDCTSQLFLKADGVLAPVPAVSSIRARQLAPRASRSCPKKDSQPKVVFTGCN